MNEHEARRSRMHPILWDELSRHRLGVTTLAQRLADAHIAILSAPWWCDSHEDGLEAMCCPHCTRGIGYGQHDDGCAWLIAARACGIAD